MALNLTVGLGEGRLWDLPLDCLPRAHRLAPDSVRHNRFLVSWQALLLL
jgi:hypothetical protein